MSSAAPPDPGDYVMLRADTLRLLLRQGDLGAAEALNGLPVPTGQLGLFTLADESGQLHPRRVAALSPTLTTLHAIPGQRFTLTAFARRPDAVLAWDEVRVLPRQTVRTVPLPDVMCAPGAPLTRYAELEGALAFTCDVDRLLEQVFGAATQEP